MPQPRFESAHGKNEIVLTCWPDIVYLTHRNYGTGDSGYCSIDWQISFDDAEALGRNLLAAVEASRALRAKQANAAARPAPVIVEPDDAA